jgi:hypothetical protein
MKTLLLLPCLSFLMLILLPASAQAQIPSEYLGKWNWNCPKMDPQFANGYMEVKKDTIITVYNSIDQLFISQNLEMKNDTAFWTIRFFGEDIHGYVIFNDPKNIKGTGTSSAGTYEMFLVKQE